MSELPTKKITELTDASVINDTDFVILQTNSSIPKTHKATISLLLNKIKTWLLSTSPFSYLSTVNKNIQTQINELITNKASITHTHDDRYFTEAEITNKFSSVTTQISGLSSSLAKKMDSNTTRINSHIVARQDNNFERGQIDLEGASSYDSIAIDNFKGDLRFYSQNEKYCITFNLKSGTISAASSGAPWSGISGKPSTFPPTSHTHDDKYIKNTYLTMESYSLYPTADNARDLGGSVYRWRGAYFVNAPSITSDRTQKKNICSLDSEKSLAFLQVLKPVSYQLINGESGRTHYGLIAQDVEEAMEKVHLTSMDFAGLIKDGDNYFLRYEEFIPLTINVIQNLNERITKLEQSYQTLQQ